MALTWTKQDVPRWDPDKQRVFGEEELAAVGLERPGDGEPVPDEWWSVARDGEVVGYGWLDSEWGDAEIAFVVAPAARGTGIGGYVVDHLADEAAKRGLRYVYNVVPDTHPDPAWMTRWLGEHGFHAGTDGTLRRTVPAREH